jgi:hypothetical protein
MLTCKFAQIVEEFTALMFGRHLDDANVDEVF